MCTYTCVYMHRKELREIPQRVNNRLSLGVGNEHSGGKVSRRGRVTYIKPLQLKCIYVSLVKLKIK